MRWQSHINPSSPNNAKMRQQTGSSLVQKTAWDMRFMHTLNKSYMCVFFFFFSFCFVFVFGYRGHIEQHSFKLLNICRLSSLKNRLIHRRSDVYFLESKPWMHGGKLDSLLGNLLTSMLVVLFDLIPRRAFSLIEAERRIFASANCAIITSDNGLHLFAARLSFEPKLVSSQLDYEEHMSMKLYL